MSEESFDEDRISILVKRLIEKEKQERTIKKALGPPITPAEPGAFDFRCGKCQTYIPETSRLYYTTKGLTTTMKGTCPYCQKMISKRIAMKNVPKVTQITLLEGRIAELKL